MVESTVKKFKIGLIGATGAIGKEIVRYVKKDPRIEELTLLVRKRLDEWKDEDFLPVKLKVIERPNFDDISDLKD
jgi:aspartate-semialdehyde dehydrogenase